MSVARRLAQRWHFARHVPLAQIAARIRLRLRRAWETRFPPARGDGAYRLATPLPQPLFAPRAAAVRCDADGWRFAFLRREVAMPGAIDWRAGGEGQLWRMNLHYMEWLEVLDGERGREAIRDWIAANPPYTRSGWDDAWNGYALSLRIVCWLQFLARHPSSENGDIARSLAGQLSFLRRHLETDLGGNHLVKNIKALIWGAACLDAPGRDDWLSIGRRLLAAEAARQILPDGVHFERSPSYHAQVFADLIECHHALAHFGVESGLKATLARMAGATAALAHPDGGAALFNDAGMTMAYPPAACLDVFAHATGQSPPRSTGPFALREGGFYGSRTAAYYLVAKMGRVGADALPAHAHADIGSFELSVGGQRMIVDQGVFEYVESEKRAAARSTASHNTVALGRSDQADVFGAFRMGARSPAPDVRFEPRDAGFVLEGRWRGAYDAPATVTRHIESDPHRIVIRDRIDGAFNGVATSALLLHPECVVRVGSDAISVTRGDIALRILSDLPLTAEPAVWWPDMGVELPTTRLRLTFPASCRESALEIRIDAGARGRP